MLSGKIKPQLIAFAFPLILGNFLQQLYNIIDSIIIGHFIDQSAFASVGIAGTIMNLFTFILSGLCMGSAVLLSGLWGANDKENYKKQYFTSLFWGSIFTLVFSIIAILLLKPLLGVMKTPKELFSYVYTYLFIIFSGLIFTFLYNLFSALFRSLGNSKISLFILLLSVVTNIILDFIFIVGLDLGIAGAALATIIAQGISVICSIIYARVRYPFLCLKKKDIDFDMDVLRKTAAFGFTSALQQSSLYIGKIIIQSFINVLGVDIIAAYTASTRLESFILATGESGEDAICVFMAQNLGNKNSKRAKEGFIQGSQLLLAYGLIISVLVFIFCPVLLQIFLSKANNVALITGIKYFKIMSFFYILCFMGNCFVGYFRGNKNLKVPFIGTTLQIFIRVILSYLIVSKYGLNGIAIATGIGWMCIVASQILYYKHYNKVSKLKVNYQ